MYNLLTAVIISSLCISFSGFLYKLVWNKLQRLPKVPTGFGLVLMLYFLLIYFNNDSLSELSLMSIFVLTLLSTIYWFDDLIEISPLVRVCIATLSGCVIASSFNTFSLENIESYIFFLIISGLFSLVLTNVVNFYDGADLNLATLMMLTSLILIFRSIGDNELERIGIYLLGFTIGFTFLNVFPKNIYLGDSGCFILSMLFLYLVFNYINKLTIANTDFLIVLSLPFFDVLFVITTRMYRKENLLSRNYLHLYQVMNSKYQSKIYLLPQIINVIVIIFISNQIVDFAEHEDLKMLFVSVFVTPLVYLTIRLCVVGRRNFFEPYN